MIGSVINIEYSTITEPFKINSKNPLEINKYIYTIQTKIIMCRLTKIVDRYSIARDEGRSNI